MKKIVTVAVSVLSVIALFPATCFASNLTDWQAAQNQVAILTQQIQQYQLMAATNPAFQPYLNQANVQLQAATKTANKLYPLAVKELQAQQTATAAPTAQQNTKVKGSYVLLANGTVVKPGGTIPVAMLPTATFVNGTGKTVQFAVIGSVGAYRVAKDPEPNWAYEGTLAPGQSLPIGSYSYLIAEPGFNCLTMELKGSGEYSFFVK